MDIKTTTNLTEFQVRFNKNVDELPIALRLALKSGLVKMKHEMRANVSGGVLKKRKGILKKAIKIRMSSRGGTVSGAVGLLKAGMHQPGFYGLFFETMVKQSYNRTSKLGKRHRVDRGKFKLKPWSTPVQDKYDDIIFRDLSRVAGEVFGGK